MLEEKVMVKECGAEFRGRIAGLIGSSQSDAPGRMRLEGTKMRKLFTVDLEMVDVGDATAKSMAFYRLPHSVFTQYIHSRLNIFSSPSGANN